MDQKPLFDTPQPQLGDVEETLHRRGVRSVVGVDEAGRGPLAGPVVAAAFWLQLPCELPGELEGLDDSKKLDVEDRRRLYEQLTGGDHHWAVAAMGPEVIDEINVLQATFRAMNTAFGEVTEAVGQTPEAVLIDGNMTIPKGPSNQRAVVGGDGRSIAIAAASVIAKVWRDRRMREADEKWPQYGFASHKGYPTPQHRDAIREHGPCRLHRRSFSGVDAAE